jgi:hypothetical protein
MKGVDKDVVDVHLKYLLDQKISVGLSYHDEGIEQNQLAHWQSLVHALVTSHRN